MKKRILATLVVVAMLVGICTMVSADGLEDLIVYSEDFEGYTGSALFPTGAVVEEYGNRYFYSLGTGDWTPFESSNILSGVESADTYTVAMRVKGVFRKLSITKEGGATWADADAAAIIYNDDRGTRLADWTWVACTIRGYSAYRIGAICQYEIPNIDFIAIDDIAIYEGDVVADLKATFSTPTPEPTPIVTPTPEVDEPTATAGTDATVAPQGYRYGDYEYRINNGTIQITKYNGTEKIVEIPSRINNTTVTSIANRAFAYNDAIQTVILADSITEIGDYAFYNCNMLNNVSLKESIKTIGEYAFFNCQSLVLVPVPESVTSIGKYALGYDSSYKLVFGFSILGYSGTEAENYCNNNGITFNSLGVSDKVPQQVKKSIKFTKKSVKIKRGWKATLKVTIKGAKKATFSVDKKGKKVVKLSKKKAKSVVVTGKKKGKATITAKAAGKKATCKVTVR